MSAAGRAKIHIVRAAKLCSSNAKGTSSCKTGSKRDAVRIVVKKYMEFGNDA
jgi:hypothetical protein